MAKAEKHIARLAREAGRFMLMLHYDVRLWSEDSSTVVVPSHESFLFNLLESRPSVYAYAAPTTRVDAALWARYSPYLVKEGRRYRLMANPQNYRDLVPFWNARGWSRGSVVFVCDGDSVDFASMFKDCHGPTIMSNPRSANNSAAYAFCRDQSAQGHVCVLLSGSNGFDWADIFAPERKFATIFRVAESVARPERRSTWEGSSAA